jgi:hypothetical protein
MRVGPALHLVLGFVVDALLTVPITCTCIVALQSTTFFAALHESAFGTKRTCQSRYVMSAFGGKADVGLALCNVCF